jgi:hypothetical protein
MAFELHRIRRSSIGSILVGALLACWGFVYGAGLGWLGYVPMLSARYQVGETVAGIGVFLIVFGVIRIYRRKGDYDDIDEPENEDEDPLWKQPGSRR